MKKSLIALAIFGIMSASAQASNNGNNNDFDDCNNCYNSPTSNTTNNQGGTGGTGGAANSASNANANSNAAAGAMAGVKSNINNTIANTNLNTNLNNAKSDSKSEATGGSVGDISIDASQHYKRDPVATAYSNLAAPSAPCMGSSSVGAQGVGFGVSVGSTWTSESCNDREDIRVAFNYGDSEVAEEMIVAKIKGYAEAKKRVEERRAKQPKVSAVPAQQVVYVRNPDVMARAIAVQDK